MTIPTLEGLNTIIDQILRTLADLTIEVGRGISRVSRDDSITLISELTPFRSQRQSSIPVLGSHILNQSIQCSSHDTQCITHRVIDDRI